MYRPKGALLLDTIHFSDVMSGKCSVSVNSKGFRYTVWKIFCFCAQYTILMNRSESVLFLCKYIILIYRPESVPFLVTVHNSDVPSGKCSVSVHSTQFWCTDWKVFCFCAKYTVLLYRPESVLFLCTVQICDVSSGKCSVSVHSTQF